VFLNRNFYGPALGGGLLIDESVDQKKTFFFSTLIQSLFPRKKKLRPLKTFWWKYSNLKSWNFCKKNTVFKETPQKKSTFTTSTIVSTSLFDNLWILTTHTKSPFHIFFSAFSFLEKILIRGVIKELDWQLFFFYLWCRSFILFKSWRYASLIPFWLHSSEISANMKTKIMPNFNTPL
jgi:hypothetical protein